MAVMYDYVLDELRLKDVVVVSLASGSLPDPLVVNNLTVNVNANIAKFTASSASILNLHANQFYASTASIGNITANNIAIASVASINLIHANALLASTATLGYTHISTIDWNLTSGVTLTVEGQMNWDPLQQTAVIGMAGGNVDAALGMETLFPKRVVNSTGSTMPKGTVVYINGVSGNDPTVTRAIATSDMTSAYTLGMTAEEITAGQKGWVTTFGELTGLNLSAFTGGDTLYLSGVSAGLFTNVAPSAPTHYVRVGTVVKATTDGALVVNVINGFELNELHNVVISSLASGQIIQSGVSSLWYNRSLASAVAEFISIPSIPSLGSLAVMNQLSFTSLINQPSLGSLAVLNAIPSLVSVNEIYANKVYASTISTGVITTQTLNIGNASTVNTSIYYDSAFENFVISNASDSQVEFKKTDSVSFNNTAGDFSMTFNPTLSLFQTGQVEFYKGLNTYFLSNQSTTELYGNLSVASGLSADTIYANTYLNLPPVSFTSLTNLPSLGSLAVLNDLSYTSLLNLPSLGSLAQISDVVVPLVLSGATLSLSQASIVHNNLGGLTTGDPHTQYALLAGRSGGQILHGGTAVDNTLILRGTSANSNTATANAFRFGTGNGGGTYVMNIKQNGAVDMTTTTTTNANALTITENISGFSGDNIGAFFSITDTAGGIKTNFAHRARLIYSGATILQGMQATSNQAQVTGGGTVNALEVLTSNLDVSNNSTVVDAKLIRLFSPTVITGGSIGTLTGLSIPNLTQGTTNWSIYSEGGAMYHSGNINIGDGYLKGNSNNAYTSPQTVGTGDILSGDSTGIFQFDASTGFQYLQRSSADAVPPIMIFYKSRGATNSPSAITAGDTAGRLSFYAYTGALVFDEVARMTAETTVGADQGVFRFSTAPDRTTGPVERLTILPGGNVGIGQGNPAQLLDVNGVAQAIDFYASDTDAAGTPAFTWSNDTNTGMYNAAADTIGFSTAGAEQMRITSAGRVGIDITTPAAQLDVRQTDAAAVIPTLNLNQVDLSEEFINFSATIGATNPIQTATTLPAAPSHRVRVAVNGTLRFIYLYAT